MLKRFVLTLLILSLSFTLWAKDVVDVAFTHDMHSHFLPFNSIMNGEQKKVGGYARLQTKIDELVEANPSLILLDAGDFAMGSLFQSIFRTHAPELMCLSMMGYDATTFGNHEFDFGDEGIVDSYNTMLRETEEGERVVLLGLSNVNDENSIIKDLELSKYLILNREGVKVAVFALLGENAARYSKLSKLEFKDIEPSAQKRVDFLKEKENPDFIICLSHSGTNVGKDYSESEDESLAQNVNGIDLIISGHSHSYFKEPIVINNTAIVSAGNYGEYLGQITFERENKTDPWKISYYNTHHITEDIEEDSNILHYLDYAMNAVNEEYLSSINYKMDDVIFRNYYDFSSNDDVYSEVETNLGDFLSDALLYLYNSSRPASEAADLAIVPAGEVRDTIYKGDVTVSDIFNVNSLGEGFDGTIGYPVMELYMTGKEIKDAVEVAVSISPLMSAANLQFSGVKFKANKARIILNKVYDVKILQNNEWVEPENDKLYKVITDLDTVRMIGAVESLSKGILKFVPKDKDGNPVTDLQKAVVLLEDGSEMKCWTAPIKIAETFDKDKDGVPLMSEKHTKIDGRRDISFSLSPSALFSGLNTIAIVIIAVVVLLLALIIFVIIKIVRFAKRKKKKGQE